jgi:hypothetical protein
MFADNVDKWVAEMIRHNGRGDHVDQHRCARCHHRLQPRQGCEGTNTTDNGVGCLSPTDDHAQCLSHGIPTVPEPPYDHNTGMYRCTDCNGGQLFCGPCTVEKHADNPLHRVKVSTTTRQVCFSLNLLIS